VGVHRFARFAVYGRGRQDAAHETKSVHLAPFHILIHLLSPPISIIYFPKHLQISPSRGKANFRFFFAYRLATLFVSPNFKGNYYALDGIYAGCYNVLKEGSVGSIMLDPSTSHCEVWAVEECGGDGDGMPSHSFPLLSK
jgi:hypothetical protein